MKNRATTGLLVQLIARETLARMARDIEATQAPLMPLKGVLLVALGVRSAADRPMIDVDVLVPPGRAPEVVRAATSRGWTVAAGNETAVTLAHPKSPMTVDLHRALFPPAFFTMDTDELFSRGARDRTTFGVDVVRMHPLDVYAHLVGHFVKGRSDRRDRLHLEDLGPVARWSGASPDEVARHLESVGLARASRYALMLAASELDDGFASEVLTRLGRDRRGRAIARAADAVLRRVEVGSQLGIPFVHALNTDLRRGVRSFLAHVNEGRSTDPMRGVWWRS